MSRPLVELVNNAESAVRQLFNILPELKERYPKARYERNGLGNAVIFTDDPRGGGEWVGYVDFLQGEIYIDGSEW